MKNKESKHIAVIRLQNALKKAEKKEPLTLKEHKGLTRLLLALGGSLMLFSCSGNYGSIGKNETGYFTLTGDAEGIKAFGDVANGLVTTGKSAPNVVDSYWQHRGDQLRFKVIRPQATQAQGVTTNGK